MISVRFLVSSVDLFQKHFRCIFVYKTNKILPKAELSSRIFGFLHSMSSPSVSSLCVLNFRFNAFALRDNPSALSGDGLPPFWVEHWLRFGLGVGLKLGVGLRLGTSTLTFTIGIDPLALAVRFSDWLVTDSVA